MRKSKRDEIERFAQSLRDVVKLPSPIDLEALIKNLGGVLISKDPFDKKAEASIRKEDDSSFVIEIDSSINERRKRFSIAHELGHLFLHMGYLVDPEKWKNVGTYIDDVQYRFGYNIEEQEANHFAGAFLMPEGEYKKIVQRNINHSNVFDIEVVANYFQVSKEAAILRGKYLGIFAWD